MKIKSRLTAAVIFAVIFVIISVICCVSPLTVRISAEESLQPRLSGNWYYRDYGDHVSVCGYAGKDGHITVPAYIDGKKVTELSYYKTKSGSIGDSQACGFLKDNETTVSVTIPNTVKSIENSTFFECANLERVDLPEGLIKIGEMAFMGCERLSSLEIPGSVIIICKNAFVGSRLSSLKLNEGLEYIGDSAFFATQVERLELPDSVRFIGETAFYFCQELESVTLPKGLTKLSPLIFGCCSKLKSVVIPEGVKTAESAFLKCDSLESVYLPSTIISVSDMLFENSSLTDIYFAMEKGDADAQISADPLYEMAVYDEDTDYSNVVLHYLQYEPLPKYDEADKKGIDGKTVLMAAAFISAAAFAVSMGMYIVLKAKNRPKSQSSKADYARDSLAKEKKCSKCGEVSGAAARYCCLCGERLRNKR